MRATRILCAARRIIYHDIENCMNSKHEREWLDGMANVHAYAARGGGADKFASIGCVVDPGRDAADKAIVADIKKTLDKEDAKVLVLTKDQGLQQALTAKFTLTPSYACCRSPLAMRRTLTLSLSLVRLR